MGKVRAGEEGEKRQALHEVTVRVTLGIVSMLLVALFVVEWATASRLRVQSSTEAGLHSFKLSVWHR